MKKPRKPKQNDLIRLTWDLKAVRIKPDVDQKRIELKDAKRLHSWLEKAIKYLESKKKRGTP